MNVEEKMTWKYTTLLTVWLAWCILHSVLIATPVMDVLKPKLGNGHRFYRLFYNIVSILTLVPVILYTRAVEEAPVFRWEGWLIVGQGLFLTAGLFLFIAGGRNYDALQFLGIRQIRTGQAAVSLDRANRINTSGILRVIRHPWYLGGLLIVWARDMSLVTMIVNFIIVVYFIIGSYLEEKKLLLEFGENYRRYQQEVSMLFPYKWLKTRIAVELRALTS